MIMITIMLTFIIIVIIIRVFLCACFISIYRLMYGLYCGTQVHCGQQGQPGVHDQRGD